MELELNNEWVAKLKKNSTQRKKKNLEEIEKLKAQKETQRKWELLEKQQELKARLEAEQKEKEELGYGNWS